MCLGHGLKVYLQTVQLKKKTNRNTRNISSNFQESLEMLRSYVQRAMHFAAVVLLHSTTSFRGTGAQMRTFCMWGCEV